LDAARLAMIISVFGGSRMSIYNSVEISTNAKRVRHAFAPTSGRRFV
jgi:hypothetical protein